MHNRYRRCCCQNNYNPQVIETLCSNVGTEASYANVSMNMENACDCGFDEEPSVFPLNPMLAQSYVPIQTMDKTFTPCCGLKMGTMFPELVSPYAPCQSIEEINYLRRANEIGEGCNS
jgi:hypothetical protein